MEDEFKYILELEGRDYGKHLGANEEYVGYVPFKETDFFLSIEEAMDALILKDIRSFEQMSETFVHDKYHEIASLRSAKNGELLLQVIRISFNDSPDGSPTAGIYFSFNDRPVVDFEEHTGFKFGEFNDYDPDSPFLLLGSYSYEANAGFSIELDRVITDRQNYLEYYERELDIIEGDWRYKVQIMEKPIAPELSHDIKCYHFHDLPAATRFFLRTDVNRLDKALAEGLEEKSWISEACLRGREDDSLVDLIAVKDPNTSEKVLEPGIHLKFSIPIQEFEESANIDLSGLDNYDEDESYLLVANYYKEPHYQNNDYLRYSDLLPHPGYTRLLIQIDTNLQVNNNLQELPPFILRVEWASSLSFQEGEEEISKPVVHETRYNTMEEGLSALLKLENHFFDSREAFEMQYPLSIKRADIVDSNKNSIVISKCRKTGDSGEGIYLSFDNNDEALGLSVALDWAFKRKSAEASVTLSEANVVERKRTTSERFIQPGGHSGPKI